MKTEIPPILEAVKQLILDWADRTTDPSEVLKSSGKIAESTISRMLNPREIPTDKTLLGFNAINFEAATGVSIYAFVIAQAKTGLWGTHDKLPEIKTHDQLVEAISGVYKKDPEGRFNLLSNRADFASRRELKETLEGRPLFWRRIPGILETIAFYTKGVDPKGGPRGESAFEVPQAKDGVSTFRSDSDEASEALLSNINSLVALTEATISPDQVPDRTKVKIARSLGRLLAAIKFTPELLEQFSGTGGHSDQGALKFLAGQTSTKRKA